MFAPPKKPQMKTCSSNGNLRRPSPINATGAKSSSRIGSGSLRAATSSASSSGALKQSSQSSLLASQPKSTSRSSILSDTSASVCSSNAATGKQHGRPTETVESKGASLSRKSSTNSLSGATRAGSSSVVVIRSSASARTGPNGRTGSASITRRPSLSGSTSSSSSASAQSAAANRRSVPTLAMSLRDKDQQIKLLIKERDEQKFQAELMARRAEEWEEKFVQSEVEKSHVTSEADDEVVELRRLAQELEDENRRLVDRLSEREQVVSDHQFKLDELECEKSELKRELADKEDLLSNMEQERREVEQGKPVAQIQTERSISKAKYEREIEELKEKIMGKDEQMIQLRSSLEMRKNEVANLQARAADLERKLKIESERSERHLKRIDEVNLELKAAEAKLAAKSEGNEIYESQVKQLRQELRSAEEKLEQVSLARKKDLDVLHNKLAAARRGSTTPTSPQPYKTPTPQDEIVRLQMEIRDLKDQLIDREAELDCNRRDLEVIKRKMETRTLEVDCNNQELARRCQDLLEQNRQSEDTVKQLLKSTTEHSAQLMHATEDLKEANGKCVKLREEINVLEGKLDEQMTKCRQLSKENSELRDENEDYREQVNMLRQQVDSLNSQLSELCQQLDIQSCNLHKDRETLADQLSQQEIELAQLAHDLATSKQDLRTSRLQTQEMQGERDRLKADLEVKEKYIASRNDIIETMRHELDDCKRALTEYKQRVEDLRLAAEAQGVESANREILKGQLETLKGELKDKTEECKALKDQCEKLRASLEEAKTRDEEEELKRFDEMRQKHSAELDSLKSTIADLELQLEELRSATLKRNKTDTSNDALASTSSSSQLSVNGTATEGPTEKPTGLKREEYETQIEFLNSLVVDMQKKCDDYRNRLAQMETMSIMNEFSDLILSKPVGDSRTTTLRRPATKSAKMNGNDPYPNVSQQQNGGGTLKRVSINTDINTINHFDNRPTRISGRPFCDICQVFDLHHTIYCPKVSEKLAARTRDQIDGAAGLNSNNNNNIINNNNNNNIYSSSTMTRASNNINGRDFSSSDVDDIFREYERSIEIDPSRQFASLRRTIDKPPRPYCDHCELFGHMTKTCNSLSQT